MTLPATIGGRAVVGSRRIAGGDINEAYRATLDDGRDVFVKTRAGAAPGEYATEAAALRWLAEPGALGVPEVVEAADGFLALEWIDEGGALDEEALGRGLALLHAAGAERVGHVPLPPLRIGRLLLPGDPAPDWPTFYAERRLLPLAGRFPSVHRLCERIHDLAGPEEPPARLHGDLWSGNVMASAGRPYVIDPAAYGGHREVDLAMLRLFGSPGPRFLAAYEDVAPLAPGHEDRVELYQLFPLLVHAELFGGGYAASVERVARRYAG
ncbi:MAG TPA: fructosamine kinase family protein [Solirubrobacteraceae bacterium]|nr:fructosamine kinase family protein [Solirubrobacteraceae bacterium]